eukprot:TRINITY_DN8764_c0_g1_i1.p1 TRINITY_DN8764_c0_g1~~TRINITY_DN8764_c0_g1_i1.p1  ORF type:complete len:482 (+),score=59.25 TRINITY_DN8764_c0_g1_i1:42-1487(+)
MGNSQDRTAYYDSMPHQPLKTDPPNVRYILVVGQRKSGKELMLASYHSTKAKPNHPRSFSPLTIEHNDRIFKFYTLELTARSDGTLDPIQWKPYYDKIELIIYIADVKDYIKTRRAEPPADLMYFKHLISCSYFWDDTNSFADLCFMVVLNRGQHEIDRESEIYQELDLAYLKLAFASKDEVLPPRVLFEPCCRLSSIEHPDQVVSLQTIIDYFNDHNLEEVISSYHDNRRKMPISQLINMKKSCINRMNTTEPLIRGQLPTAATHAELNMKPKDYDMILKTVTDSTYRLTELNLKYNGLSKVFVKDLMLALSDNKTILTLVLSHNTLNEVTNHIADMLRINNVLRTLVLLNTSIDDAGANMLAKAIEYNSALQVLDLSENSIDAGVGSLCNALLANSTITSVSLWRNTIMKTGINALGEVIQYSRTIRELNLAEVGTTEKDVVNWIDRLRHAKKTKLHKLHVTPLSEEHRVEINKYLSST